MRKGTKMIAAGLILCMLCGLAGCGSKPEDKAPKADEGSGTETANVAEEAGDTQAEESAANDSGEKETVEFWYLWGGDEEKALLEAIDLYNASQDKYFVKGTMCDMQKQTAGMAGSSGPDITDIVDLSVSGLASKGALENLTPYIERDSFDLSAFNNAAMRLCDYEGNTYGFPLNAMSSMIYYNKAALEEAGITELPKTMDELMDVAVKLTKFDADGNITQLGWPLGVPSGIEFARIANHFGVTWVSEDKTSATCDEEAMIAMYNFLLDYLNEIGGLEKLLKFSDSYDSAKATSEDPLFTGKQALRLDGMYLTNIITKSGYSIDDFGVFPLPYWQEKPELEGVASIVSSIFIIPKNAKNKEGAWDFMKWVHSDEGMTFICSRFQNEASRTTLLGNGELKAVNPLYEQFVENGAKNPVSIFPSVKNSDMYMQELSSVTDAILRGTMTPEDGMKQLKAKIEPLLK